MAISISSQGRLLIVSLINLLYYCVCFSGVVIFITRPVYHKTLARMTIHKWILCHLIGTALMVIPYITGIEINENEKNILWPLSGLTSVTNELGYLSHVILLLI
jgi:hypothetical protein